MANSLRAFQQSIKKSKRQNVEALELPGREDSLSCPILWESRPASRSLCCRQQSFGFRLAQKSTQSRARAIIEPEPDILRQVLQCKAQRPAMPWTVFCGNCLRIRHAFVT